MDNDSDVKLQQAFFHRTKFFETLGRVEPLLLSYLINPTLVGGPRWPALRQGFLVVQRENTTLFASHGLSDPFDDGSVGCGFGVELVSEVDERVAFDDVSSHWGFWILAKCSQLVASIGGDKILGLIDELGPLSTEVENLALPESWQNSKGRAGVLIGLQSPDLPTIFDLPLGKVRLLTLKLLTPSELAMILSDGDSGRARLCDLFAAKKTGHVSSANRVSVI